MDRRNPRYSPASESFSLPYENRFRAKPSSNPSVKSDSVSEHFTFDRRGDRQNLSYGLGQYGVSRFRSAGHGRLLGLDGKFKISRETGNVELVVADTASRSRRHEKSILSSKLNDDGESEVIKSEKTRVEEDAIRLQDNYVPLKSRKRRRRSLADGEYSNSSVAVDMLERDPDDDGSSSTENDKVIPSETPFEAFRTDKRRQRLIELERRTRHTPTDADAWIELISHQDQMDIPSSALPGTKVDIYERALENVRSADGRETLTLGMLKEGAKIWDSKTLNRKWELGLREFKSVKLWKEYLNLQQTSFQSFNLDDCLSRYMRCLKTCREIPQSQKGDCVYFLLRITVLLKQAGFVERAVAIWQAILEWTTPQTTKDPTDEARELEAFEAFWESEAPRIGEEGSRGWRNAACEPLSPQSHPTGGTENPASKVEKWAADEQYLARLAKMPARILDPNPEDDPFRVVVFADVQDFLFHPRTAEDYHSLFNGFLLFCDLPVLSGSPEHVRNWSIDPFVREFRVQGSSTPTGSSAFSVIAPNFALDTLTLFADPEHWFNPWPKPDVLSVLDQRWVKQTLKQLIESTSSPKEALEYAMAHELQSSPTTARKFAKSLLKHHSDDLRLYNAFALVESRLGNVDAAEKVWSTALSFSKTLPESEQQRRILLWRCWIWTLMDRQNIRRARNVIIHLGHTLPDFDTAPGDLERLQSLDASTQLRLRRYFQENIARYIDLHNFELVVHHTDVLALSNYVGSTDPSLWSIAATYQETFEKLNQLPDGVPRVILELLHQSSARLMHFHATSYPYRPRDMAELLNPLLSQYPDNTILLRLKQYHSSPLDRLRSILPTISQLHPSHLPHSRPPHPSLLSETETETPIQALHSIQTELNRSTESGRTTHTVRSAFRRALSSSTNPSLWLSYLEWESHLFERPLLSNDDQKQRSSTTTHHQAVKILDTTYHAALRACPWSRTLHLAAFTHPIIRRALLCRSGDESEILSTTLKEIYECMQERGLRIYREFRW